MIKVEVLECTHSFKFGKIICRAGRTYYGVVREQKNTVKSYKSVSIYVDSMGRNVVAYNIPTANYMTFNEGIVKQRFFLLKEIFFVENKKKLREIVEATGCLEKK